jgi:hypothetical protein
MCAGERCRSELGVRRGRTGGEKNIDVPLLKRIHVVEDVRQDEIEQRPELREVVLWEDVSVYLSGKRQRRRNHDEAVHVMQILHGRAGTEQYHH